MKLDARDLKKAIQWVEANTNADIVDFYIGDNKAVITTIDKYSTQVEIILYENSSMLAKIKKTEVL